MSERPQCAMSCGEPPWYKLRARWAAEQEEFRAYYAKAKAIESASDALIAAALAWEASFLDGPDLAANTTGLIRAVRAYRKATEETP